MDEKKAVTMDQLLESARQGEALTMQVAQAAQAEMEKRPTSTEVNEAMDRLFTSVSDGKSLIASAITDKGVSTAADASFQTMRGNILAIESGGSMPEGVYLINVSAITAEGGTVSGGGVASEGMTLTVSANAADGYNFEGWQENGEVVSTDNTYTFTVTGNRTFVAGFADVSTELVWVETTLPSTLKWSHITYGDGKFVAIASQQNISAYSTDGINWTESTMPYGFWRDFSYGNGIFVAITNQKSFYSTDGINWSAEISLPSLTGASWKGVTYGNGKFVAISGYSSYSTTNGKVAAYSTDCINWKKTTLPDAQDWTRVIYGNGKFVAVSTGRYNSGNGAAYSEDGISWTKATLPSSADWESLTFGNGKFVTVAANSDKVAYSEDGISWRGATLPSSADWRTVTYGNGKFVAVAANSDKVAYSEDGISWTDATLPSSEKWYSITYGNERFVVVAINSDKVAYTL